MSDVGEAPGRRMPLFPGAVILLGRGDGEVACFLTSRGLRRRVEWKGEDEAVP